MTYQLSIDEMSESLIQDELSNRERWREQGGCDYCGRAPTTSSCKYPVRHADVRIDRDAPRCAVCNGDGRGPNPIGVGYCGTCQGSGLLLGNTLHRKN